MAKFKRGNLNLKTDNKVILSTTLETFLKFDGAALLLNAPGSNIQLSSDAVLVDGYLVMSIGAQINEFSTDVTLSGDSNIALPTEKAVKTYVDAQIAATDEHDELLGLQGGDSTAGEFFHLTQDIYDGLFSESPTIGVGTPGGASLKIDYGGGGEVELYAANGIKAFETSAIGINVFRDSFSAQLAFDGSGALVLDNDTGTNITLQANNKNLLGAWSTGPLTLYYAGENRLETHSQGIKLSRGTYISWLLQDALGGLVIRQSEPGKFVTIQSMNAANDELHRLFDADPDGATELYYDGNKVFETDTTGIIVIGTAEVDTPTKPEHATTKAYVDSIVGKETFSGVSIISNAATSVVVVFDTPQVDDNYSIVTNIVNTVDSPPSIYGHMTTAFDANGFTEIFSGPMDSGDYELHFIVSRNDLVSSSSSLSSSSSSSTSISSSSSSSESSSSSSEVPIAVFGMWGFGSNSNGELGLGDIANRSSPTQIGSLFEWQIIANGNGHALGIKDTGSLWSWGASNQGGLGIGGDPAIKYSSPVQIGALTDWLSVSAGNNFSLFYRNDGTLWSCGDGINGATGLGTTTDYSSPVQIGALTDWIENISCGYSSVAATKSDGTLWTWGRNADGQCGIGNTTTPQNSPVQVGALTNWDVVSSGGEHVAALKTDGTIWTWGANPYGQLGDGTITGTSSPNQVGALTDWVQISAGGNHCAGIRSGGTLWTWGRNAFGNLGQNNLTSYSSPVQVGALTDWANVECYQGYTIATKTDGTLWAVGGRNFAGELGLGTSDIGRSSPVQIGALTNWSYSTQGNGLFSIHRTT